MITTLALLTARDDLTFEAFVDHYENRHVPLILGLAPAPAEYVRSYLPPRDSRGSAADFDVVTRMSFADEVALRRWRAAIAMNAELVAEDEARFLDRDRTRSWRVLVG